MKKILLTFILGIFLLANIMALDSLGTFKQNENLRITQVCSDATYITITSISYPNSTNVVGNFNMTSSNGEFYYVFNFTNTIGKYDVRGISDGCEKTFTTYFEIREDGVEITDARANLTIGLLGILVFLLFISLYSLFNIENYIGKFALYWASHVLMILISFVAWQVGVEGLLGGMALTGIFRIMFWIFTIAVLPMVILSGAWIFYIHVFNEHFEKLIDKGMDTENAFRMASKKSGGWFNGR